MGLWKKGIGFIIVLLLALCAVFFALRPSILEWISVLERDRGLQHYEAAAVAEDGTACAVGWAGEDTLTFRFFNLSGGRLGEWEIGLPQGLEGGSVAGVYPLDGESAFCGIYTADAGQLKLFVLRRDGQAQCLLTLDCSGVSAAQRRENTRLLSVSRWEGQLGFALADETGVAGYLWDGGSGLRMAARWEGEDARGAVLLPDETLAVSAPEGLLLDGKPGAGIPAEHRPVLLCQAETGIYYVDAVSLELYYCDFTGSAVRRVLTLAGTEQVSLTSLSITSQGEALLLLDGGYLTRIDQAGAAEMTGILAPGHRESILMLALCGLGALVCAWLVWYVLWGLILKGWLPLLVQGGAALLTAALVAGMLVYWGWLLPWEKAQDLELDVAAAGTLTELSMAEGKTEKDLEEDLTLILEESGHADTVWVTAVRWDGGCWRDSGGNRAELSPAVDLSLAGQARETGDSAARRTGNTFWYALVWGDKGVCLRFTRPAEDGRPLWYAVAAALTLVTAVGLLLLLTISRNAQRLVRVTEQLSRGNRPVRWPRLGSGDELEGMSRTLESLARSIRSRSGEQEGLIDSYRRFVPERMISLLGKQSIQEVDKGSLATRYMAVMMVSFRFPEPLYTVAQNSRLLFDSVNEIIERTASIAAGRGGTVFNFAYNGYDVVMDDCPNLVSGAVAMAQEVLSFNTAREQAGLPTVTFRIALDVGDVLLGVVGDSTQMEPTTISTCFATVRELVGLCGRLEANILCTEAVISQVENYACRYMGKCLQDSRKVRVYEIFSGDEYDVRCGKQGSVRRFSEGVLALYSGDTAQAKRIFLELAHQNNRDGGVRYYLHLADQMEKNPGRSCGLDV